MTGGVTVVKVGIGTPNKEQYIYYNYTFNHVVERRKETIQTIHCLSNYTIEHFYRVYIASYKQEVLGEFETVM